MHFVKFFFFFFVEQWDNDPSLTILFDRDDFQCHQSSQGIYVHMISLIEA